MSSPRIDGLFTTGVTPDSYRLPHPKLGLPVVLLIRRVLLYAFEVLRERGFRFAEMHENAITETLRALIENDLRQNGQVKGFNRKTYETVVRQGEVSNYDFTKKGKSPDLCFKLRDGNEEPRPVLSEHDALFVECKPIDKTHYAGREYCDKGLCRFVDGDYAWAMEEGLMLGYARDRTIVKHLLPAIQSRLERLQVVELPKPIARPDTRAPAAEALRVSRHRRGFPWVDDKGPATDILVYHSWHNCD